MAKLTKSQEFANAWRMVMADERLYEFEQFKAAWHLKPFKAIVLVGGANKAEFLVKALDDGATFWMFACNLPGKKTWYEDTACVYYDKGQEVEVMLNLQYGATFCVGVTAGTVNEEKWASLDQSKLAFKCNEEGQAVTGLFA